MGHSSAATHHFAAIQPPPPRRIPPPRQTAELEAAPSAAGVVLTSAADGLAQIAAEDITLALWCRSPDAAIQRELPGEASVLSTPLRCDLAVAALIEGAGPLLAESLAAQGLETDAYPHWLADMAALADRFARLVDAVLGATQVTLRLEALMEVACPRLHVDQTRLRQLCTYRGHGTEWLPPALVDRRALAAGLPNDQIADPKQVRALEPFWIGVFKGERFPGNAGRGQVHRSPAVADGALPRLLFCLDA
jgi:hypothetical protein